MHVLWDFIGRFFLFVWYNMTMSAANDLTNKIIDYIYRQGGYAWRASSVGIYDQQLHSFRTAAKKGVADILACIPPAGKLAAIEVKIGKDRLSPEQAGFLENIKAVGGLAFVARSFEEFVCWWKEVIHI